MTPCAIAEPENAQGGLSVFDSSLASVTEALPGSATPDSPGIESSLPAHVTDHLVGGTSALGLGVFIERGTGFLANILAARLGGASTFGAYSLAISTANNISTYAAGQIGSTAARFSGKYPKGTGGYTTLARALTIVSLVSAALAAAALWLGAGPIAHVLGKAALTSLLRWAAISAAGMILLECARGFFVGQRHLRALVLLSVVVGFGMITLLPAAAYRHNPVRMAVLQGTVTTSAVLVCLLLSGPLRLRSRFPGEALRLGPVLREIWSFGFIQLAGLAGSNLSGWWLMTLVARGDTTLVQMSFFAIASQLRNLVGIAPSLLTEGSYAVMADPRHEAEKTPHRVMALCSYASLSVSLLLAAVGIVIAPWLLRLLYGKSYAAAGLTAAVALATAVVHMGNAPAAARLTIVSIRSTGVINTVWAVFVAVAACSMLFHGGSAAQAMAIYFAAHILSATLVLLTLKRKDHIPAGMTAMFALGSLSTTLLVVSAFLRNARPALLLPLTLLMLVILACTVVALIVLGKRYRWIPSRSAVRALGARLPLPKWRPRRV